ncbi:uncharacterized protein LOC123312851 isoform X2 [Coccinella septempunctata]|uniref:uncharacterized protein LOC123312851 isoform X2 n=1 Tax=Coccinella septempunctata TaxID=41139 RepID=UPI001D07F427|nr:uncharacterized protein LOC123312851 isoform X2 [Coccinella septempunctata]
MTMFFFVLIISMMMWRGTIRACRNLIGMNTGYFRINNKLKAKDLQPQNQYFELKDREDNVKPDGQSTIESNQSQGSMSTSEDSKRMTKSSESSIDETPDFEDTYL